MVLFPRVHHVFIEPDDTHENIKGLRDAHCLESEKVQMGY